MLKRALALTAAALLALSAAPFEAAAQEVDDVFIDEGSEDAPEPMPDDTASTSAEPDEEGTAAAESAPDIMAEAAEGPKPKAKKPAAKAKARSETKTAKAHKPHNPGRKEGFRMLKADCEMRRDPASDSPVVLTVKGDRKLWVEEVDGEWVKGFRKKGHGYMSSECFE